MDVKLPLKEWKRGQLLAVLKQYKEQNPQTQTGRLWDASRISDHNLRKHTLKLAETKNGQDLYVFDPAKAETLTPEKIELILNEQKLKKSLPEQREKYRVSYISKGPDGFQTIEEEVEVKERMFRGQDGQRHHLDEKYVKIIERLL